MKSLFFLSLVAFILTCSTGCNKNELNETPNVIIIFIDDMGYADPSCFGNPLVKTPNIDALAESGMKFTNFYVNAPICSPSRVALNTGQYPMRHQIHSYIHHSKANAERAMANFLKPDVNTIAKTLKDNGYKTAHIGKWHLGGGRDVDYAPLIQEYGFDKSFTSFEGLGDRVLFNNHPLSKQSAELEKGKILWADKCDVTKMYVDSALAFVNRNKETPFYLHLFPDDVHDEHWPRPENVEIFKSITDNPYEQQFFAVLEELDNQIGRFIAGLKEMGELDNTLIIFTSDNGPTDWPWYFDRSTYPESYEGELYAPGFANPFNGRKWSLYEGGIRMPFIVNWAGHIEQGTVDSTTVMSAIDFYPTICSILGIDYPEDLDGVDKSKAFFGEPILEVPPIMWQYASNRGGSILPGDTSNISPNMAIRDGDWKLLINVDGTDGKLYNLKEDQGETTNLILEEEEIAEELTNKLISWRKAIPVDLREDE